MNAPIGYDDNIEFQNTHSDFLPKDQLETVEIKISKVSNTSVLGDIGNVTPGEILTNRGSSRNKVKWSDIASKGIK